MPVKTIEVPPGTGTGQSPRPYRQTERGGPARAALNVGQILLPVDFTERSIVAARCAADLAQRFGGEVALLHVAAPGGPGCGDFRRVERAVDEALQAIPFRRLSSTGDPARRIVEHARQQSAGLILMPTRGRKRCGGLRRDSVAFRVMQHAHCPVWTGVEDVSHPSAIRSVLCALALGPRSAKVLQWASLLADCFNARLSIVHAHAGFGEAFESGDYFGLDAARRAWARQDIAALQRDAGTQADVWLEAGDPERVVTSAARLIGADLLVIGRSPGIWFFRNLWSRAYNLVCQAPCPVAVC